MVQKPTPGSAILQWRCREPIQVMNGVNRLLTGNMKNYHKICFWKGKVIYMNSFVYDIPTRVYFGPDQLDNLGKEVSALGKKALLCYGGGSV